MIKELFFEGKTIPEAVETAAAALLVDKDLLTYEVVAMPVKGIFGIGGKPAKIKVEQEVADPVPAPKKEQKKVEFVEKIAKNQPKKNNAPKGEKKEKPPVPKAKNKVEFEEKFAKKTTEAVAKAKAPKEEILPEIKPLEEIGGEVADTIKEFLGGALFNMGIEDAVIQVGKTEEEKTLEVRVAGSHMGVLIGRRGETLDAMQYLISLVVNRKFDDKIRIILDTENYRAKRIAALTSLAEKTAAKAIKYKKNMVLEPMSPYERRIIHAALSGKEHIATHSVGSEPRRKVVVTYVK